MSAYLGTGIVCNIFIDKKNMIDAKLEVDKITKKSIKCINFDCYRYEGKDNEHYCWTLKEALLQENLVNFLKKQFAMYDDEESPDEQMLDLIQSAKSGKE